ncbi:MAG: 3-dehydroquinate synthase [Lachnospiraceae bacterium]|nr:3-dehydroquinate synthase [Lachnospiraceae bacterium]
MNYNELRAYNQASGFTGLMLSFAGRRFTKKVMIYFKNDFDGLKEAFSSLSIRPKRICIVGDTNTVPLYGDLVKCVLSKVFDTVDVYAFPVGEENKNLHAIEGLYLFLLEHRYDRKDCLLALGGGVVGDMAGFAAATYLRGISYVQVPTTLLSQVDSSIGGKTGVDYLGYKNMVGAFHLPEFIYTNPVTLKTLSDREFTSGMGEVLKTALLADGNFFEWILDNMDGITEKDDKIILEMVRRTAEIKADIVARDPKEKGERALLNLGHTIGHAIEKSKNFTMPHGMCVGLGCIAAAAISHSRGLLETEELYEIRDVCVMFGLPIYVDGIDSKEILKITKSDKKMAGGRIRFILLEEIGKAFIADDVTDEEILSGIHFINGDVNGKLFSRDSGNYYSGDALYGE